MAVVNVSRPAPKIEPATKNRSKEDHAAEVEKARVRAKVDEVNRAKKQVAEVGNKINIAV